MQHKEAHTETVALIKVTKVIQTKRHAVIIQQFVFSMLVDTRGEG